MNRSWSVDDDPARSGLTLMFSTVDSDLRRFYALRDFVQRPSRLWGILEVDRANAQREVSGRQGEGKGGRVDVPVRF